MRRRRVLALEITSTLFGFAVLEGPERLIIWGTRGIDDDVSVFLTKLDREVRRYRPDLVVLEEAANTRKGKRVQKHLVWVEQWASDNDLKWEAIPSNELTEWSRHLGPNKGKRAQALSELFPELVPLVPPPRRIWEPEAKRLAVFVGLTRGLYCYERAERQAAARSRGEVADGSIRPVRRLRKDRP